MDERNKAMQYAHVSIWGGGRGSQCSHASIWGGGSHAVFSRKYMGVGEASHVPCNILTQVYGGGGSEPCNLVPRLFPLPRERPWLGLVT